MTNASPSPHYRPLQSRPEATALTVRELLQRVRSGRVRVPDFQRPLRWGRQQNLQLLDSIWRGYPIGSLLFWKRQAEADRIRIGTAELDVGRALDAWWVVDGQQRITALAATLLDLPQARGERRWELFFDVQECAFVAGDGTTHVPLNVLGDLRRLGQYFRTVPWGDNTELTDAAEEAQQRILDYSIPVYIVDADNEDALRAIFARMNSTGSRMRADEVFHALFGAHGNEQGLDLHRLQKACDRDGFGVLSRSEVLKMVLAMSGEDPTRRVEGLSEQKLANLVPANEAENTIAQVIDFLKEDAGIPHARLVPYPVVFSILSRWFRQFPGTSEYDRGRLAYWLWRGAATAAHQRAEVSKMRDQLRLIGENESESLARLLERVEEGYDPSKPWRLARFNGQSAHSRIETLALLSLNPVSVPDDELGMNEPHPIDYRVLVAQSRVAREIFASRDWEDLADSIKELARSGANRALLEEGHTGLQSQLRRLQHRTMLESHLIDEEALGALCRRDVSAFLQIRGEALQRAVQAFLERKTGRDEPVRLARIDHYLDPAEAGA